MSELTSNEVPQKFAEWLLAMGCHSEIVPPVEKVAQKCRGQYYMVWRNLMEKVEPKHVIQNKRPQVFCDDIQRCQKKNALNERISNTVVPEELLLWHRHTQLKEKVAEAEARIRKEKEENLHQLADKAYSKLCQRYLLRKRLQDGQRSAFLLQRLADEQRDERAKVLETKTIAESLCGLNEETDVESTLDKCIASLSCPGAASKAGAPLASASNSAFSTTASTSDINDEEAMSSVARCRGELLFKQLYERRAGLCAAISADHSDSTTSTRGVRSVVCHTASLHCSLALEATKNRIHIDRTRNKLAKTFLHLDNYLTSEACELLVTRCEVACSEARIASLRSSIEELASKSGVFAVERPRDNPPTGTTIHAVDRAIESKRDELKILITSVAAVERKTQNVRERLLFRFNSFHDVGVDRDRFGVSKSLPQDSIAALRQFYEEKREKRKSKPNLSMDFSDGCSFSDLTDNRSPTFIDELKLYLNKFNLEKNRKIVLESGEKIWTFESSASSLRDIHTAWQGGEPAGAPLRPCATLQQNLRRLARLAERKEHLHSLLRAVGAARNHGREIDISQSKDEEQKILDRIKKRLNDNILCLQKTSKTLDVGMENLQLWADNSMKKYISDKREVNGRSYAQYERAFLSS